MSPFTFPAVDFASHPYYRELSSAATPEFRRETTVKYYTVFKALVTQQVSFQQYLQEHPDKNPASTSRELDELKTRGIVTLRLSQQDRDVMHKLLHPAEEKLLQQRNAIDPEKRAVAAASVTVCQRPQNEEKGELFGFFERLMADYGVLDLCRQYKGVPYDLQFVALQHNTSEDRGLARICGFEDGTRSRSYYTHIDSSIECMKVILYVTPDVDRERGAFRYFPGSHDKISLLEQAIRKANDKCGWENPAKLSHRAAFAALPADYQKKANFGNDLLDDAVVDDLMAHEEVFESKGGDILLFNPDGAHRGAIFTKDGERKILQFLLRPRLT